jgi:hypothetical protein
VWLVLSALGCAPVASRLSDARPEQGPDYFYAEVGKKKGRAIERLSEPGSVTSRYGASKRSTMYVIQDAGVAAIDRYEFVELDKVTVTLLLRRRSDVGGGGIEQATVRRDETITLEYPKAELYRAFALLQSLSTDPAGTVAAEAPEAWKIVAEPAQIDPQEAGFAIAIDAELHTGNPFDATARVLLYRLQAQTPYQRAADASG